MAPVTNEQRDKLIGQQAAMADLICLCDDDIDDFTRVDLSAEQNTAMWEELKSWRNLFQERYSFFTKQLEAKP